MTTPTTTIRLPGNLRADLTRQVARTGIPQSTLIAKLLRMGLVALAKVPDDIATQLIAEAAMEKYEVCAYCGAEISENDEDYGSVPSADNDDEWARIQGKHGKDCEWAQSRAHNLPLD